MSGMSSNLPKLSNEEIQTIDRALEEFKQALNLPSRDPSRMHAAVSLRRVGFTANQIITLSRGEWTRQTVGRWVKSTSAAANAPAERAVTILADAVEKNVTLDHLLLGLNIQTLLAAEGVLVNDLARMLKGLKDEDVSLAEFVEHYKMMKETGLQFADVKRHLDYKNSLEKQGFGLDSLRQIQTAAQKYDNPDTVLRAIDTYESIENLEESLANLRESNLSEEKRRSTLNETVTQLETRQTTLQTTINDNQNTIQQLNRATELGYNLETLKNLEERTRTFGGIEKFLIALAQYPDLLKLEITITETQTKLNNLNGEKSKVEGENLQYKTEIETTRTLIRDHKLGLQALQELLQLCEKYGAPEEVFRAVRAFDNLKSLESNIITEEKKLAGLKETEKQLTEKLNQHIPEMERQLKSIQETFQKDTDETKTKLKTDLTNLLTKVHEAGKSYQQLVDRGKENEPYLELLEIVKDPHNVANSSRILNTTELILKKLLEWIPLNASVFKLALASDSVKERIELLVDVLERTEYIR